MSVWNSLSGVPIRASQDEGQRDEPDTLDLDVAYTAWDRKIRLGLWSDGLVRNNNGGIDAEVYLSDEAALALAVRLKEAVERNRKKDEGQ